jgi:hypothetical protein
MAAGTYNITAEKNQALHIDIQYKDDQDAGFDLSTTTITMTVKDNAADNNAALSLTFAGDADGNFTIALTSEQVNGLNFNQGIYYIDLTGTIETRLLEGKLQVTDNSAY